MIEAQGDDAPPELYSREAFTEMAKNGPLPPEILPLLQLFTVTDFARLPDSMQTKAYHIHAGIRNPYPCARPCLLSTALPKSDVNIQSGGLLSASK